ncbi:rhodanese-like domain-containing protein [Enterovibrio coralii]|uniref:Rhodanese domain-containing protein n=1 Tax=Enterovibrio coralii TaxID=294935 RepID=A0A135I5M5_9GAMM|nr:rhodanese-like domain-containing protein [Enterovibrio coralii]KXF80743.1 hypothetical protein ATN88_15760 [Enterovibrio coralii]
MLRKTKWIITLLLGSVFSTYLHAEIVWVDVRSVAEHQVDSIDGDLRISHPQIVTEIAKLYPEKDTEIRLYCRSGFRASKAQSLLNDAGYVNVFNEGGIHDARKVRGIHPNNSKK